MKVHHFLLSIISIGILAFSCQKEPEIIKVESVALNSTSLTIVEGESQSLTATVSPSNADNKKVSWSSSNSSVATVDDRGTVTAIAPGTATITAKSDDGGKTATCAVTVKEKVYPVESVSLDKTTAEITEGETITLTATVKPDNASNKKVIWSSSNEEIATVKDGVVTAIKEGEVTITAKTEDGGKTATCAVKVKAKIIAVESVSLDKTTAEITEGETITLTATVKPDNTTDKTVTWSSSDEAVATVKDGVVTAIKAGSATITAKAGEKTATCAVTVNAKKIRALSFSADGEQNINIRNYGSNAPSLQYSYDAINWTDWDYSELSFGNREKQVLYLRGNNPTGFSVSDINFSNFYFSTNAKVQCNGNIMHLLSYTEDLTKVPSNYCYYDMFSDCTNLVSAPELPATTLAEYCYSRMFSRCTSLQTAPELPATTLADGCYSRMFGGCTSLQTAPELPATTLANDCYFYMFNGCESIVTAPTLPAITLAEGCYSHMFPGCTSLVSAPELPATTLASDCYSQMFGGCTSLQTAPELPATTLAESCYQGMFSSCTNLVSAPELPATTLANDCYSNMFTACTNLVSVPKLPATTLAKSCYFQMFNGCISLVSAPELPATTLAESCYALMFLSCTSLQKAPELPATTLAEECYHTMFSDCTNLVSAPELPATTLAESCYINMFFGCTSLQKAPELPATTLAESCYLNMFGGCSKLNYVKALFTSTPSANYTNNWLSRVSSTGTFVKSKNATWDVTGPSGIPEGWTVQIAE